MRRLIGPAVITIALVVLALGFAAAAAAQSDAARAIYASAANVQTNIAGVHTFAAASAGFDPRSASDEALATYGFPPRPDKTADPDGYARWAAAMALAKHQWNGELKPHPEIRVGTIALPKSSVDADATPAASTGPTIIYGTCCSGIVNTIPVTRWGARSIDSVNAQYNVPVAQQAFTTLGSPGNICDGTVDVEITYAAIDNDPLDGEFLSSGTSSIAYCASGGLSIAYYAEFQWVPAPYTVGFAVNPGDDMYVQVYSVLGGCNPGYTFIEDLTQQIYSTYEVTQPSPTTCLVGNAAMLIVARAFGDSATLTGLFPLANYVNEFAISTSQNGKGTIFYPGSKTPSTYLGIMTDDSGTINTSVAVQEGNSSIYFYDENCAEVGGCTP